MAGLAHWCRTRPGPLVPGPSRILLTKTRGLRAANPGSPVELRAGLRIKYSQALYF